MAACRQLGCRREPPRAALGRPGPEPALIHWRPHVSPAAIHDLIAVGPRRLLLSPAARAPSRATARPPRCAISRSRRAGGLGLRPSRAARGARSCGVRVHALAHEPRSTTGPRSKHASRSRPPPATGSRPADRRSHPRLWVASLGRRSHPRLWTAGPGKAWGGTGVLQQHRPGRAGGRAGARVSAGCLRPWEAAARARAGIEPREAPHTGAACARARGRTRSCADSLAGRGRGAERCYCVVWVRSINKSNPYDILNRATVILGNFVCVIADA